MTAHAQGGSVGAVGQMGRIDIDNLAGRLPHGEAAADTAKTADGKGFCRRAADVSAVFGRKRSGRAHRNAGAAKGAI